MLCTTAKLWEQSLSNLTPPQKKLKKGPRGKSETDQLGAEGGYVPKHASDLGLLINICFRSHEKDIWLGIVVQDSID